MKPTDIQDAYRKAMSDYWFCEEYSNQIAIVTLEHRQRIVKLHNQYKNDPEIKKINEHALWVDEKIKGGIL